MFDLLERGYRTGTQPWVRLWHEGHGETWRGITTFAAEHRGALIDALCA